MFVGLLTGYLQATYINKLQTNKFMYNGVMYQEHYAITYAIPSENQYQIDVAVGQTDSRNYCFIFLNGNAFYNIQIDTKINASLGHPSVFSIMPGYDLYSVQDCQFRTLITGTVGQFTVQTITFMRNKQEHPYLRIHNSQLNYTTILKQTGGPLQLAGITVLLSGQRLNVLNTSVKIVTELTPNTHQMSGLVLLANQSVIAVRNASICGVYYSA